MTDDEIIKLWKNGLSKNQFEKVIYEYIKNAKEER